MEMYAVERRRWIVDHAREAGRIDVADVAAALSVARETVRRDLNALEGEGYLRRVHGGAVPVERLGFEGRLASRRIARQDVKARIAEHATTLVGSAELIFIDEGSTAQAFAERLHPSRPLTVVTNALSVALVLANREHLEVIALGGRVRPSSLGTVDHWAVGMVSSFVFDLAFVGTNGFTLDRGLTCPHAGVAAVKTTALRASRRVVLMTDGSKYGVDSTYRFGELREVTTLVTDRTTGDGPLRRIRAQGVEAVVV
jgi:DeoR family fructose operon transcriptional repressor